MAGTMDTSKVNPFIFRAYDIRGIYGKDLDESVARRIGQALSHFVATKAVVGCDHRLSSPALKAALADGLLSMGRDVLDLGTVNRGIIGFAGWQLDLPVVLISASHLPAEWNGVKTYRGNGMDLTTEEVLRLKELFFGPDIPETSPGRLETADWRERYLDFLTQQIRPAEHPTRILVDCGNGAGALIGPELLRRLGFEVTTLFEELDGRFPNRPSELDDESLESARQLMTGHDLCIAYDGDADRLALLDETGAMVEPERAAYLILRELLKEEDGPIVANVSCSRAIDVVAERFGRKVHRSPVGFGRVTEMMRQTGAAFGMESSMHFGIPSLVPYDDGPAVGAYIAWAVSRARQQGRTASQVIADIPSFYQKKRNFDVPDEVKFQIMDALMARLEATYPKTNKLDGIRVDLDQGWALMRCSQTSPMIRLQVEAESEDALEPMWRTFATPLEAAIAEAAKGA